VDELASLHALAERLGVATGYRDGLGRPRVPPPETLLQACIALGAPMEAVRDAADALRAVASWHAGAWLPAVAVARDGWLPTLALPGDAFDPRLELEDGTVHPVEFGDAGLRLAAPLPLGYHTLAIERHGITHRCRVLAAPTETFRDAGRRRGWGVATQVAALRSRRSRSVGDLADLAMLCEWVTERGGDLVGVLPLLPTFNGAPAEPSPYAPVSRLFWSELMLDLGEAHVPAHLDGLLDVARADAEVRAALANRPVPPEALADAELRRYAQFRGAQARLGRNWRAWPADARGGQLRTDQVDGEVERFHLVAEIEARWQLAALRARLDARGMRLGLDLAVGVHPDGYDTWSRQALFAAGISVGAPPDAGFPSGQDWGFPPVLPTASRAEGHAYLGASMRHQLRVAGVLRIDHIMALARLYWIPHGMDLHAGTYVSYPSEELFAILALESHRHRTEIVGENLGTVPAEITAALERHRIAGMYVAQFEANSTAPTLRQPSADEAAMIGTHDTPTFAGWVAGEDIGARVAAGLLAADEEQAVRAERAAAVARLATEVGADAADPRGMLRAVLGWLGGSPSPLVTVWLEDLWLEEGSINLPGTAADLRPNWQRPLAAPLEDLLADPEVVTLAEVLAVARRGRP